MMITDSSKRVIPFRERDAKRIGDGCFYLDSIVWLNGDRIELGDNVGFNVGCFINGFSGLVVGDGTNFGPYSMVHTANHNMEDTERPVTEQGWRDEPPIRIGRNCWVGMGAMILNGARIGEDSLIAASALVPQGIVVPPRSLVTGVPGSVRRELSDAEIAKQPAQHAGVSAAHRTTPRRRQLGVAALYYQILTSTRSLRLVAMLRILAR